MSKNELSGPFPAWLSDMPALRFLNLSENQLSGVIPLSFADSEAFEVVYVHCCILCWNPRTPVS